MALAFLLLVQLVMLVLIDGLLPRIVVLTSTPMSVHVPRCSKEVRAASYEREGQEAIMFEQRTHAYCGRTRSTQQSAGCLRKSGLIAVRDGDVASEETSGRLGWIGKTFLVILL